MPYRAPASQVINDSLFQLSSIYTTSNKDREKTCTLIKKVRESTISSDYIIGCMVFVMDEIYKEYNYLSPTRSNLYKALTNTLGITPQNPMSANDKIIYLTYFHKFTIDEASVNLDDTRFENIRALRSAIESTIEDIAKQAFPSLFTPPEPKTTSYLNYVPQTIGSIGNYIYSSVVTSPSEEVMNLECCTAVTRMPASDKMDAFKKSLLTATTYKFEGVGPKLQALHL